MTLSEEKQLNIGLHLHLMSKQSHHVTRHCVARGLGRVKLCEPGCQKLQGENFAEERTFSASFGLLTEGTFSASTVLC